MFLYSRKIRLMSTNDSLDMSLGLKAIVGSVGTVGCYKYLNQKYQNRNVLLVKAKTESPVQYKWDFNWDHRHPQDDWPDAKKDLYTYVVAGKYSSDNLRKG